MRAARLTAFGDPPTFELDELAEPSPGPGEVLIDLEAAAINRRDRWIWAMPGYCPLPVTLGSDGSGRVAAVGSGVSGLSVGAEVVFDATLNWGPSEECPTADFDILGAPTEGTLADRVLIPAANVVPKPARLSWEEAAAVNLAGLTAWRATVTCAGAGPGTTLLVTGAGSGVSTFIVQIAVALGARVFVTSSTPEKIERALELGAEAGFSYHDADWPEQVLAAAGGGLDAAIDSFGGPSWPGALAALRTGGTLVSFGDTSPEPASLQVSDVYWQWRRILGTTMGSPREYRALLTHVEQADWRPVIDSVYGLDDIDAAAARLGSLERFGKVVLKIR